MKHCFANAGKCPNPAVVQVDDGAGGTAWSCAHHAEELEAWEKLFESLPADKIRRLDEEITKAEISALDKPVREERKQ